MSKTKKQPRKVNHSKGYPDGTEPFDNTKLRRQRQADEAREAAKRKGLNQ